MTQTLRKGPQTPEWPTLLLLTAVYATYASVLIYAVHLPAWIGTAVLALLIAQHSSLQHEVLHGHPFRSTFWSDLTVFPALGVFVPYLRFKQTHLQHHFDPNLTDPYDDPETNYLDPVAFDRLSAAQKWVFRANTTLLGRMILGPAIGIAQFYRSELRKLAQADRAVWWAWAHHMMGLAAIVWFFSEVATMPPLQYVLAAYLGMSLLKVRTFLEHRFDERAAARSVIVEDRGLFALLFLNNNLHAVHHAHPRVPWYKLPALYRTRRDTYLNRNGDYRYANYREVFARHLVAPKDSVCHPRWSATNRGSAHDPHKGTLLPGR